MGETEAWRYVGYINPDNRYSIASDYDILTYLFRLIYKKYGIQTTALEASSNVYAWDNGHPAGSHSEGEGFDLSYYGWETGFLLVEPTLALFEWLHLIYPKMMILVGPNVINMLEDFANTSLPYLLDVDVSSHEFGDKEWYHIHLDFRYRLGGFINWNAGGDL